MDLFVSATSEEIQPFIKNLPVGNKFFNLVSGVGCVETTLNLTRYLHGKDLSAISKVINIGVAGAYLDTGVEILDICIAEQETLADFGICNEDKIEPFTFRGRPDITISADSKLLEETRTNLVDGSITAKTGNFLTVNSVSGTAARGNYLRDHHQAICENMEGFAVAKVCMSFDLPFLELRCISNYVEDRNIDNWKFKEACYRLSESARYF